MSEFIIGAFNALTGEPVLILMATINLILWGFIFVANGDYLRGFTRYHALMLAMTVLLLGGFDFLISISTDDELLKTVGRWWRFFFYTNLLLIAIAQVWQKHNER